IKKELEFIEKELASVGKEFEGKKIMEAAGTVVASMNARYETMKKELEIIKIAHTRLKNEYETTKKELESLKSSYKKLT
ncbi:MAG TPA: hypothetical protein VNX68_10205, partial [Nitrosopumilaceae archaeon]|nr:hypothetical protein [Nitrosopumilaceae archaeon]